MVCSCACVHPCVLVGGRVIAWQHWCVCICVCGSGNDSGVCVHADVGRRSKTLHMC